MEGKTESQREREGGRDRQREGKIYGGKDRQRDTQRGRRDRQVGNRNRER